MSSSNSSSSTSAEDNESNDMPETIEVKIVEQNPAPIPLFLKKLWKMVNDPIAEQIIGWNNTGDGFIIYDQVKFVTELLPQYFKHNNLSSFIRQLNFYDFHKVANVDKHEMEFAHSCFLKDLPETLAFITRKVPNVKSRTIQGIKQESINEVLTGVKELKSKHCLIDNELKLLKQENASLWNEINSLRIKYSKQTKVINKLIHFLISYMHSHQNSFNKTNITVNRKHDQKLLRNTPQLFQIDYCKTPSTNSEIKSNSKIPGCSKTVTITAPNNVKKSCQKYYIQYPKLISSNENSIKETATIDTKKCPLPTMSSHPMEKIVCQINPENYNVTSPVNNENVFESSLESPYPIEEIVTEVDPNLEETSVYTVKFPKSDIRTNQNIQNSGIAVSETHNSNLINNQKKIRPVIQNTAQSGLESAKKIIPGKRKSSDGQLLHRPVQKEKMLSTPQKKAKVLKLTIPHTSTIETNGKTIFSQPKIKQSGTRGKRKQPRSVLEKTLQENPIPQPSPVKPEVVLEDLFSEIENPSTSQTDPEFTPSSIPNLDDLGFHLDSPQSGNEPESLICDAQPEVIFPIQESNQGTVDSPDDLFSVLTANTVDSGSKTLSHDAPEEILSSPSTSQEAVQSDKDPFLRSENQNDFEELDSYPDDMLSSLTDMPQVISPSKELLMYNFIGNSKEKLGSYLDNTQLQLNNIQDLLNDLNSEELFDLLSCFNVDKDDNSEQKNNNMLGPNNSINKY